MGVMLKWIAGFFTGGSSIWLPWAIAGGLALALGGTLWVQSARLDAARSARDAAVQALDMIRQDRDRQAAAVAQRDKVIAEQTAQLEQHRADEAKAAQVAAQVESDRQAQIAKLKTDLASLKEKARANPDQVRPLGPIVLDALRVR